MNWQCSDAEAQTFWLAQFVQAGGLRMFYQYAVEVHKRTTGYGRCIVAVWAL